MPLTSIVNVIIIVPLIYLNGLLFNGYTSWYNKPSYETCLISNNGVNISLKPIFSCIQHIIKNHENKETLIIYG
jgi:hypothetical protein